MGQQPAASETWRSQNKPTSRGSYEIMGQQKPQSNESHPAVEPDHVKNSKSPFETDRKIPSENERKSSDFAPYGMAVNHENKAPDPRDPSFHWDHKRRLRAADNHAAARRSIGEFGRLLIYRAALPRNSP